MSVTLGFDGSTRAMPAGANETHTPFAVKATCEGWPASPTDWDLPDDGSTRRSADPTVSATHSAPSPTAMPAGPVPTPGIVWLTAFVSASIRLTVESPPFVTHTDPMPTATPAGEVPTGIVSTIEPVSRSRRATLARSG